MPITTNSDSPLFVVHGATGAQGSSVIKHIALSSQPYRVRALVRDPQKASDLVKQGVELYKFENGTGPEKRAEAKKAFAGASIVFVMSNLGPNEVEEGKTLADAAHDAGVSLFVFGGLPNLAKGSGGKYTAAYPFDNKSVVVSHARSIFAPNSVIDVQPAGYMSTHLALIAAGRQPDGSYELSLPVDGDTPTEEFLDTERDFGAFVVAAVERSEDKRLIEVHAAARKSISYNEVCRLVAQASGKDVRYKYITVDDFVSPRVAAGMPEDFAKAFAECFASTGEFGFYAPHKTTTQAELPLKTEPIEWKDYVKEQDWSKILQ